MKNATKTEFAKDLQAIFDKYKKGGVCLAVNQEDRLEIYSHGGDNFDDVIKFLKMVVRDLDEAIVREVEPVKPSDLFTWDDWKKQI